MTKYDDLNDYNWLMGEILRHEQPQAEALGELLWAKLHPHYVVDVGCGPGIYLLPFKKHGCIIFGLDGASGAGQNLDKAEFCLMDFRTDKPFYAEADLVLCIEVAEHVPAEYADNLMDIVCGAGDIVFFCAARPGQGGEGHCNEQGQHYWVEKFRARGFDFHSLDDEIHEVVMARPEYEVERTQWLRHNSFMMQRQAKHGVANRNPN
jgi:SAM-dependent methyltransferase